MSRREKLQVCFFIIASAVGSAVGVAIAWGQVARANSPEDVSHAVMVAALFPPELRSLYITVCGVAGAFFGLLSGMVIWSFWRIHTIRSATRKTKNRGVIRKPST